MATTSHPPSPLYDPSQRDIYAHGYPQSYYPLEPYHEQDTRPQGYFYNVSAESSSANSLHEQRTHAHDASPHHHLEPSHQYYGGAMPYAVEYVSPGDNWVQHKQATHPYAPVPPLVPFYDEGEVSPTSDGSSGAFYDSPRASDDARLVDDHPPFAPYDAPYPHASIITAERYSFQETDAYHQQPVPQTHLSFNSDFGSSDAGYLERPPSGDHQHVPSRTMTALQRTQSPMAHLPYVDLPHEPQFYLPPSTTAYACPQPQYHSAFPAPIAIPAPRSPPLVEDMPKKPLTLACFFCRKRKIACGSPPPGKKDRTCNQCARRNLRCEYPVNSRRGTRQREAEAALYPSEVAYARASA